jgi:hypothetical protein
MLELIVYCTLSCANLIAGLPHTAVAELDRGQAVAVGESAVIALMRSDPAIPILYFSRQSFQDAVRDLNPEQTRAAIAHRLERSAGAFDRMPDWIFRTERGCLSLAASQLAASQPSESDGTRTFVEQTLGLLSRLASERRYDGTPALELLVYALEHESELIAELRALGSSGDSGIEAEIRSRTWGRCCS